MLKAVDAAIDESIGCVIIEPIQAENGAIVPRPGYLQELRQICSRHKVLLIFDEAKTGFGKTGQMFACMYEEACQTSSFVAKHWEEALCQLAPSSPDEGLGRDSG